MKHKILIISIFCSLCFTATQAQWKKVFDVPSGYQVDDTYCYFNRVFAHNNKGLNMSLDSGKSWNLIDSSDPMKISSRMIRKGNLLFILSGSTGVYTSFDSGSTWKAPSLWPYGANGAYPIDIIVSGNNIVTGLIDDRMLVSKDDGKTWDTADKGLPPVPWWRGSVDGLTRIGNATLVFYSGNLYISHDDGLTWSYKADSVPQISWGSILPFHNRIFLGFDHVFMSEDTGENWQKKYALKSAGSSHVNGFCTDGKILLAATQGDYGVLVSRDSGENWVAMSTGLTNTILYGISMDSTFIYVGTDKGQVFRRSTSEITNMNSPASSTEELFRFKVYPNPFHHFTNFEFGRELKEGSIAIYDMNGKEVRAYSHINAESYRLSCDNLASGTYIYIVVENNKKLATGKLQIQ